MSAARISDRSAAALSAVLRGAVVLLVRLVGCSLPLGCSVLVGCSVLLGCSAPSGTEAIGSASSDSAAAGPPATATGTVGAAAPVRPSSDERRQALSVLLDLRASALAAKDKAGWMATVDDPTTAYGVRQAALFDRMIRLPIAGYGPQSIDVRPPLDPLRASQVGPNAWVGAVQLSYRLAPYDRAPRSFTASYTVVQRSSGWRIADDTDGPSQAQAWDLGGLAVVSSATALVIGNVSAANLRDYLALADAGSARVARLWGAPTPAVLVAPATNSELMGQLGRTDGTGLDQVAALTEGPFGRGLPAGSDRVYINPQSFGRLTADGRRVVITHELTHVAIRAASTAPVPMWLSEGFADYVGFSGVKVKTATVASDLLARVRAGRGPTALPAEADFDPARGVIAPSYNAAWLAVTRLAQTHGEAKLVEFYRAVAGGSTAGQAFGTVLGTTQDAFIADWLAYLRRLSG